MKKWNVVKKKYCDWCVKENIYYALKCLPFVFNPFFNFITTNQDEDQNMLNDIPYIFSFLCR